MDRRDLACWNCGELAVNEPLPLSRHAACQHCFEMLHCCVMCRHFDPSSRPTCQHDLADPLARATARIFVTIYRRILGEIVRADDRATARRHRWLNCLVMTRARIWVARNMK